MRKLLLALLILFPFSLEAAPPPGAKTIMMPIKMLCVPSFADMMGALTKDFAVHISSTFKVNDTLNVAIVENPDTGTIGILALTDDSTCIVFSGQFLQKFERPPNMAPPELNMEGNPYKEILL
tara:strand:- start:95 stop:463 length:369 start_codon:yes stop_codon:yes gene_type:complete